MLHVLMDLPNFLKVHLAEQSTRECELSTLVVMPTLTVSKV